MPLFPPRVQPNVDFWRAAGHSWLQYQTGPSGDQTGRVDALFRSAMDVEYSSWRNYANSGARIAGAGRGLGGWTKVAQRIRPPAGRTYPYAPDGGGTLLCFGINDLNGYGGNLANVRSAIVHAHRACISRCRASREYLVDATNWTWGAGFTANASGPDLGMGTIDRVASSGGVAPVANQTFTLTLPSDYTGETVAIAMLHRADLTGGTITWSGTAGRTGTFNCGSGLPASMGTFGWMVQRFSGMTAANAGQTIIGTVTAWDNNTGSSVFIDGAWLESKTPPPVIVCNVARPTAAGYTVLGTQYNAWVGSGNPSGTEASRDADVQAYNAALAAMLQEFDGMVQLADVDSLVGKDVNAFSDGIHPNEYGSGEIVDAMIAARNNLRDPASASSHSIGFNPPSPRVAARRLPRVVGNWYTADYSSAGATYTPVAGHFMAIPFEITESRDQWNQICMEVTTAGTAAGSIRWGIYEDVAPDGYPGELLAAMDFSVSAAFSVPISTGVKTSATFSSLFVPDPGQYWLALKVDTAGTGQVYRALTGPSPVLPNLSATGLSVTNGYMGWQLTGQATGALPTSFPTGGALMVNPPMIGLRKSR